MHAQWCEYRLSDVGTGSVVWVWAQWCGYGLSGVGMGSVVWVRAQWCGYRLSGMGTGQEDNLLLRLCCDEAHPSSWEQHDLG